MITKIVLASGSNSRKRLLNLVRMPFEVFPSEVNESLVREKNFAIRAKKIAQLKAEWVAERKQGIIVASDTFTVCGGRLLGKPKDKNEAREMLKFLSGKSFVSYTGFHCLNTSSGKIFADTTETIVEFRKLTKEEIEDSLKHDPVIEWAGAYNVSQASIKFVNSTRGFLYLLKNFFGRFASMCIFI